jgi:hypothetical protein
MADASDDLCAPLAVVMDEATLDARRRVQLMERTTTAERVARDVQDSGAAWVAVEGFSRAGKSVFAARLSHILGWSHILLDNMSHGRSLESERYTDFLDHAKIIDRVGAVDERRRVVVEGVCLEDVMAGKRLDKPFRIYIARVSRPGTGTLIWHDGAALELPAAEASKEISLERDTIRYHRRVKPHALADCVLVRIEKASLTAPLA